MKNIQNHSSQKKQTQEQQQQEEEKSSDYQYFNFFLQLIKKGMQQDVSNTPSLTQPSQSTIAQKENSQQAIQTEQRTISTQVYTEQSLILSPHADQVDLVKLTALSNDLNEFTQKNMLIQFLKNLINKKRLIRTNKIDSELLNDVPFPLLKFKPLFLACIKQLIFSYSIHKQQLQQIDKSFQEQILEKLYNRDTNELIVEQFIKSIRKKKIKKQSKISRIKTKIVQDLKKLKAQNYLKIYKCFTSFAFPKNLEMKFHSKITNVINDYLALLKKDKKFDSFFEIFQQQHKLDKVQQSQDASYSLQKYIKRFPLHQLIKFIQQNNYYNLFNQHIKDKKEELI